MITGTSQVIIRYLSDSFTININVKYTMSMLRCGYFSVHYRHRAKCWSTKMGEVLMLTTWCNLDTFWTALIGHYVLFNLDGVWFSAVAVVNNNSMVFSLFTSISLLCSNIIIYVLNKEKTGRCTPIWASFYTSYCFRWKPQTIVEQVL